MCRSNVAIKIRKNIAKYRELYFLKEIFVLRNDQAPWKILIYYAHWKHSLDFSLGSSINDKREIAGKYIERKLVTALKEKKQSSNSVFHFLECWFPLLLRPIDTNLFVLNKYRCCCLRSNKTTEFSIAVVIRKMRRTKRHIARYRRVKTLEQ